MTGEATRTLPVKDGVLDLAALEAAYLKATLGNGAVSGDAAVSALRSSSETV